MKKPIIATPGALLLATATVLLCAPRAGFAQTQVCHVPPDAGAQVITVDDDAVPGHLDHGDCLGDCACLTQSTCSPKAIRKVHAKNNDAVFGNARLSRIVDGKVACLHLDEAWAAQCVFKRTSGIWVETAEGDFALAGQAIALDGKPGGEFVVASQGEPGRTVPCVEATSRDSVGAATGQELAFSCTIQTLNSPTNFGGLPLMNYATREVCTSSFPHPDGALFSRMNGESYCYIGQGAGLNDVNGTERDQAGVYLLGPENCHVLHTGGYEVPGAKRPATAGGYPVKLNIKTPILWRPVTTSVVVANP